MHGEGSKTECCCQFPTSPFCWILQHFVRCTVCPPSPPARALSPQCGQGHTASCAVLAEQHKSPSRWGHPREQMQGYGCLCSIHAVVSCQACRMSPVTPPRAAAPWAECSPEPQMPSAHVSHIPVVFSPLQVLQFPLRAMCSLAEANQYAPGPLSYKIPTYLKRGWGAQTFSFDPAL